MRLQDIPEDIEPRVGDIIEIEQDDVCFEVRIIGITADGYLCEQDNVEGAVLLEGVALDQDDVTDITGYITEEKVRLDPKCWKGKKIGNPKTKMKGGVRVNNCVPEGQQEVAEAGPFSYGYKKPRKGSVAYWAEKKRKEQEKGKPPIEPKDQMVGVAKVTKGVAEGSEKNVVKSIKVGNFRHDLVDTGMGWQVRIYNGDELYDTGLSKNSKQKGLAALEDAVAYTEKQTRTKRQGVAEGSDKLQGTPVVSLADLGDKDNKKNKYGQTVPKKLKKDDPRVKFHKDEKQGVAEGYTGRETKDGTWRVFKDGQAVAVAGPFKSRDEAHAWIKNHKQGVSEAKSLKKRVRVVQGEHAGKTGWIREIKHGIHSTAPKRYYVDIDGGGQANNLPASALRLLKDQSDSQKGMAEGGHDDQFSLSGRVPATDRIPQDSTRHQDQQLAMGDKIKQQTIAYILNLRPEFERSDLELATTPELIQMLRDIQSGKMTEAEYQGRKVPLGKPMAGDVKKSKVYVRKPNGKVVKVNFGDKNMKIKKSNPKRRKSFRARHNCENPGPRWKARYWSCRAW
jgi:hypothetical protein